MASLNLDARSGVHAANHALLIVAPLFVVADPADISTEHVYPRQHRPRPLRLILYDARPGGLGRPTRSSEGSTRRWARRDDCCRSVRVAFQFGMPCLSARAYVQWLQRESRSTGRSHYCGCRAGGTAFDLPTRRRVAGAAARLRATRRSGLAWARRRRSRAWALVAAGLSAARRCSLLLMLGFGDVVLASDGGRSCASPRCFDSVGAGRPARTDKSQGHSFGHQAPGVGSPVCWTECRAFRDVCKRSHSAPPQVAQTGTRLLAGSSRRTRLRSTNSERSRDP